MATRNGATQPEVIPAGGLAPNPLQYIRYEHIGLIESFFKDVKMNPDFVAAHLLFVVKVATGQMPINTDEGPRYMPDLKVASLAIQQMAAATGLNLRGSPELTLMASDNGLMGRFAALISQAKKALGPTSPPPELPAPAIEPDLVPAIPTQTESEFLHHANTEHDNPSES